MVISNQAELKIKLQDLCHDFNLSHNNMEVDNGSSFSSTIISYFGGAFYT